MAELAADVGMRTEVLPTSSPIVEAEPLPDMFEPVALAPVPEPITVVEIAEVNEQTEVKPATSLIIEMEPEPLKIDPVVAAPVSEPIMKAVEESPTKHTE